MLFTKTWLERRNTKFDVHLYNFKMESKRKTVEVTTIQECRIRAGVPKLSLTMHP